MQQVQPQPQRYTTSYIMSNHGSMVSSVAPSARNSPPMQPMQPRIAVPAFQQMEPVRQYVPVDSAYARASVGHSYPSQPQVRLCLRETCTRSCHAHTHKLCLYGTLIFTFVCISCVSLLVFFLDIPGIYYASTTPSPASTTPSYVLLCCKHGPSTNFILTLAL